MRLFSEEVKTTSSNSPLNIIQVKDWKEIFFGVLEVEINEKKYPVEEVAKHRGNPVVLLPIVVEGVEKEYPFVLLKGKQEIFFNENNTEIPASDEEILEESTEIDREQLLIDIEKLKKDSVKQAQEELSRHLEIVKEKTKREKQKKEKALKIYLENARENLVEEFTAISQRIKREVFENNDGRYSEIQETIDNRIDEIRNSLGESLSKNFQKSSQLIDKSIKQLVKELYEKNINPRVDKELHNIASEIHEKVLEIDKNLNSKLDKKADRSLVEAVNKEMDSIRDANIELNNSLNKGVQKALSRVGNVDKKVIQISEEFERKLEEKEQEVVNYFDEKLALIKEETLDITDEARKYFQNLIQESRDGLLSEIRKIKVEKPVEYILETKKSGKVVKDWDSIEKEWNTKIHDKIENVKTDLRKYVAVYASGGGTNATQYQDGGTMNGDLTVVGNIFTDNLAISGDLISVDSITFDTTAAEESAVGKLKWNDEDGTLDLGLKGGNVTLQIGQETVIRAVNKTNTDLLESNYKVVRIRTESEGGSQGQRLAIVLAQADSDDNSVDTLGLVTENINNNQEGFVTTFGLVRNINTTGSLQGETWSDGDVVYLSPTVAGRLTNIKPQAPQHTVIVGFVVYSHQNNGKIFVKVDNGYELDELHNIKINDVANSDILTYDSGLGVWKNSNSINVATLSADRIYTTQLDALSANITVIDIKQYELSGFNVLGDSTVQGSISASGTITADDMLVMGDLTVSENISATNTYSNNLVYNTGDQTIGGDKTFTDDLIVNGQITAPNQTDTTQDSVLTRSLADARYLSNIGLLGLASITLVDVAMGFSSGAVNTTLNQPALSGATELRLTTTVGMAVGMTIATSAMTGIPLGAFITAINAAAVSPLPNVTISAPLTADVASGTTINTVVIAGGTASASGRSMLASTSTTLGSESSLLFGGFNPSPFVYPGEPSSGSTGINFDRKTYFGFKITMAHGSNSAPNAGADGWVRMGCSRQYRKYGAPEAPNKSVGIWRSAGSYYGWVMDGTTLNIGATPIFTTTSGLNPVTLVEITGDGLGNFTFYINGVAMQTLTGGPTGQSGQEGTQFAICVRNLTGGTNSNCSMAIVNGQFIFTYLE